MNTLIEDVDICHSLYKHGIIYACIMSDQVHSKDSKRRLYSAFVETASQFEEDKVREILKRYSVSQNLGFDESDQRKNRKSVREIMAAWNTSPCADDVWKIIYDQKRIPMLEGCDAPDDQPVFMTNHIFKTAIYERLVKKEMICQQMLQCVCNNSFFKTFDDSFACLVSLLYPILKTYQETQHIIMYVVTFTDFLLDEQAWIEKSGDVIKEKPSNLSKLKEIVECIYENTKPGYISRLFIMCGLDLVETDNHWISIVFDFRPSRQAKAFIFPEWANNGENFYPLVDDLARNGGFKVISKSIIHASKQDNWHEIQRKMIRKNDIDFSCGYTMMRHLILGSVVRDLSNAEVIQKMAALDKQFILIFVHFFGLLWQSLETEKKKIDERSMRNFQENLRNELESFNLELLVFPTEICIDFSNLIAPFYILTVQIPFEQNDDGPDHPELVDLQPRYAINFEWSDNPPESITECAMQAEAAMLVKQIIENFEYRLTCLSDLLAIVQSK